MATESVRSNGAGGAGPGAGSRAGGPGGGWAGLPKPALHLGSLSERALRRARQLGAVGINVQAGALGACGTLEALEQPETPDPTPEMEAVRRTVEAHGLEVLSVQVPPRMTYGIPQEGF